MSFWQSAFSLFGITGPVRREGTQHATPFVYGASPAKPVTFDTAMQVSAFWACVRLIAETVAGLPLVMYRVQNGQRQVDTNHPLWLTLSLKPNRYQTRVEFFETVLLNLCTSGNAYCRIERTGALISSLTPLMSAQVETKLLSDGSVVHCYHREAGVEVLSSDSVWHIKLFGNGVIGLSPMAYARQSLGIAQAAEDRVSEIFRNGLKPAGVLMLEKSLTQKQREEIRLNFKGLAEGNDQSLILLEAGAKYQQVALTPQDVELMATRRFQLEDVARFMGVPSVLINDTAGSTVWGSGIGQLIEGWYKLGLRPFLERIECSALVHLMPISEQRQYELEFDFDALLRADSVRRLESLAKAVTSTIITPNEARAMEGRAGKEGGDELLAQTNLMPLPMLGSAAGNIVSISHDADKPAVGRVPNHGVIGN